MGGLRRRVRERDGLVERDTRFIDATELMQPRTPRAEEVEIALQLFTERPVRATSRRPPRG